MMNAPKIVLIASLSLLVLAACDGKNPLTSDASSTAPVSTPAPAVKPVPKAKATPKPKPKPVCDNCGSIISITPIVVKGESSGAGGAIGAVVGGLLGHQVGGGKGKDIATVVGVVGGAVAGNEIEKKKNSTSYYDFVVAMEQGGERTLRLDSTQGLTVGSAVMVVGNSLILR